MVKLAVTTVALTLLFAANAAARPAVSNAQRVLPKAGVMIVGKSLAGVQLGHTSAKVKKIWGTRYQVCPKDMCKDQTWLYFYPPGTIDPGVDPVGGVVGAAVRFRNNKAVAIFTLGATLGWRTSQGLKVADPSSKAYELYGEPKFTNCIGYQALSLQGGKIVSSIYLTSGVVYGFAITVRGLPVCQ
jgi:hypothetical protein